MSEHRNLNAQLNSIKADAIEETNKQNIANEQSIRKLELLILKNIMIGLTKLKIYSQDLINI